MNSKIKLMIDLEEEDSTYPAPDKQQKREEPQCCPSLRDIINGARRLICGNPANQIDDSKKRL